MKNTKNNVSTSEPSALERHIAWFSKDGFVTTATVENGFRKLKDSSIAAYRKTIPIMFFSGLQTKGCPFKSFKSEEGVGTLNHARDTTLFNMDGSINEEQWIELLTYSESHMGTEIITEAKFYEFLKTCRINDKRQDNWPYIAEAASNGEWQDFFEKCSDYWKANGKEYERAVTVATLRRFYDDAPAVFDDVVEGRLPVAHPGR